MAVDGVTFNNEFFTGLGRSPGVVTLCMDVANATAANFRATAPVDTGELRDKVKVYTRPAAHRTVVVVEVTAPHAMINEAKNGTLARALKKAARS